MGYTKRELSLKSAGFVDLATAVVRQWKVDGQPRSDAVGIQLWSQVMQYHRKLSGVHNGTLNGVHKKWQPW